MPRRAVTLAAAALELGVDRSTVQGWVRRGAPVVRPGTVGRAGSALVDVEALRAWRNGGISPAQLVDAVALAQAMLVAFEKPSEGSAAPIWRELGIPRRQAAALYVCLYGELVRMMTGHPVDADGLPPEMRTIFRISLESR